MKKFLLTLLALFLAFSLMSCEFNIDSIFGSIGDGGGDASSSTNQDEEDEDDEEDQDEEDEDSSTSEIVFPDKPDRNVYSNEITEDGKWVYGNYQLKAPTFTNFYNGYSTALSMTFDDGYDIGTGTYVTSVFKQYGFRGTAMLGPCFLNDSLVEQWNDVVEEGYLDVGCHGYDHLNPWDIDESKYEHEIKDAIDFLREKFPSQRVLTFATPYAHITDSYEEYLKQFVISNRLEAEGSTVKVGQDNNLYRVKSISVFSTSNASSFNQGIASALKQSGTWTVELLHCVKDGASGRDATKQFFSDHCQYLYNNHRNTTWIASFEDVSIYLRQLDSAKVSYVASDRESMTISVTHDLDKSIYNIPMTVKLQVPSSIDSAYAVVDGKEYTLKVSKGSGVNSVLVTDIPVTGESVKVYLGGNGDYANGCDHYYKESEKVAANCKTHGYTINECITCRITYKSNFKSILPHDFSGDRVVEEDATAEQNGSEYIKCKNCDNKKIIETKYTNIANEGNTTTSDPINEWTYVKSMFDSDVDTNWTNGSTLLEITHSFDEARVDYIEITFERLCAQDMTVSVYDGTEWTVVGEWSSNTEESSDSVLTKTYDVSSTATKVKFVFNTSIGSTRICEIGVYGIIDVK